MTKTPKRTYTDEQKAEALEAYKEHGPAEAGRRTGISPKTIASWAKRANVKMDAPLERMRAATEAASTKREFEAADFNLRMQLALADIAETAAAKELSILTQGEPTLEKVVGARTRAIHDLQLLTGAATSRNENREVVEVRDHAESLIDRFKDKKQRDELAERRKAKHG